MQRRARVEAEPVDERDPALLVDGEGVGLPPRPVERQHQEPAQRLPQRVLAHEGLELRRWPRPGGRGRDRPGAGARGPRRAAPPAGHLSGRTPLLEVRKRRPAPEPERLAQHVARLPRSPSARSRRPRRTSFRTAPGRGLRLDPKRYPVGRVSTADGPSSFRSCETYTWTAFVAVGGGCSPQSSSTIRAAGTTSLTRNRSTARSARCFAPASESSRPSSQTASGPRMPYSKQRTYHLQQMIDGDPDAPLFDSPATLRRFLSDNPPPSARNPAERAAPPSSSSSAWRVLMPPT